MSEIEQLKKRIKDANYDGLTTAVINDDYEPAGKLMTMRLVDSGEFVSRRDGMGQGEWKVWAKEFAPY